MFDFGRAEWVDIEANKFALLAIAVALERADLVEGNAQVRAPEGLVLVELQSVLIVEMQRPELAKSHGEIDFVRGVEARQDGVSGFDETANSFRVTSELSDGQSMANGR